MGLFDFLKRDKDALEDPVIVLESESGNEEQLEPPLDETKVEDLPEEPLEDIGVDYDEYEVVTEDENTGEVTAEFVSASQAEALEARSTVRGRKRTVRPKYGITGTVGPAPRFTWREVACNNGTRLPARYKPKAVLLARTMNNMRANIASAYKVHPSRIFITVNSWYRTPAYNAAIGGVGNSTHTNGSAADVVVYVRTSYGKMRRVPPATVARIAEKRPSFRKGGIGRYRNFTHLDVRGYRARWWG